jgi:SAM-dependent methyltransferase
MESVRIDRWIVSLRETERESIRAYVQGAANQGFFKGRVLDLGAGKQPYRDILEEAGAMYFAHDLPTYPASTVREQVGDEDPLYLPDAWDAVLCTQVIQYMEYPFEELEKILEALYPGGRLVITGPTNWPVVETQDLHRFTEEGIARLLMEAGFAEVSSSYRANIVYEGERWPLGWGAIARKETE